MTLPSELNEPNNEPIQSFIPNSTPYQDAYSVWIAYQDFLDTTQYVRATFQLVDGGMGNNTPDSADLVTAMVDGLRAAGYTAYGAHTVSTVDNTEINPAPAA